MRCVRRFGLAALVAGVVAVSSLPAWGGGYVFTDVVNSTGPLDLFHAEVINNRGTMAFIATTDPEPGETRGTSSLYTIRDGVVAQVSGYEGEVNSSFDLHINGRD